MRKDPFSDALGEEMRAEESKTREQDCQEKHFCMKRRG